MTTQDGRDAFKESGLTYEVIARNINTLKNYIQVELDKLPANGGLEMKVSKKHRMGLNEFDRAFIYLYIDGPYFKKRECISFNPDGFIGFAGWASSINSDPIVRGFIRFIQGYQAQNKKPCPACGSADDVTCEECKATAARSFTAHEMDGQTA